MSAAVPLLQTIEPDSDDIPGQIGSPAPTNTPKPKTPIVLTPTNHASSQGMASTPADAENGEPNFMN